MQPVDFLDRLSDFRKARVLVIGDVMLDRYVSGEIERISPEAPVPVLRLHCALHACGSIRRHGHVGGGAAGVDGCGGSSFVYGCGSSHDL